MVKVGKIFSNNYNDLIKWIDLYGQQGVFMSGMGIDDIVLKDEIKKFKNNIYNIEFDNDYNSVFFVMNDNEGRPHQYIVSLI